MLYCSDQKEYLGTHIFIEIGSENNKTSQEVIEKIFQEAQRIEMKYSRFVASSKLSEVNKNLNTWMPVDTEFFGLLEQAQTLQEKTHHCFDISVKSILDSWGYDAQYSLSRQDFEGKTKDFKLDKAKQQVLIEAEIDFGGLGKGFFLDAAVEILNSYNIDNAFINAGGDLYARGKDQNSAPHTIYFEHPTNLDQAIGETAIDRLFCGSSSPARRKWREFHHLVNPHQKEPAIQNSIVYTQHASSGLLADAYSTALFVMGFEKAKEYLEQNPNEIEAMLVSPDYTYWFTPGFQKNMYTVEYTA